MNYPHVIECIMFAHWPGAGFEDTLLRREGEGGGDNRLKSQGHHLYFNAYWRHDSLAVGDSYFLEHHNQPGY